MPTPYVRFHGYMLNTSPNDYIKGYALQSIRTQLINQQALSAWELKYESPYWGGSFPSNFLNNNAEPYIVLELKSSNLWPDHSYQPQIFLGATLRQSLGTSYRYGQYTGDQNCRFFVCMAPFGGWNPTTEQFESENRPNVCSTDRYFSSYRVAYIFSLDKYMAILQFYRYGTYNSETELIDPYDDTRPEGFAIGRFHSPLPSDTDPLPLLVCGRDPYVRDALYGWAGDAWTDGSYTYIRTTDGYWKRPGFIGSNSYGGGFDSHLLGNARLAQDGTTDVAFPVQVWSQGDDYRTGVGGTRSGNYEGILSDFAYQVGFDVPNQSDLTTVYSVTGYAT